VLISRLWGIMEMKRQKENIQDKKEKVGMLKTLAQTQLNQKLPEDLAQASPITPRREVT